MQNEALKAAIKELRREGIKEGGCWPLAARLATGQSIHDLVSKLSDEAKETLMEGEGVNYKEWVPATPAQGQIISNMIKTNSDKAISVTRQWPNVRALIRIPGHVFAAVEGTIYDHLTLGSKFGYQSSKRQKRSWGWAQAVLVTDLKHAAELVEAKGWLEANGGK